MFRVPSKLSQYVDFDNGKLIISKDLPKELEDDVKELEKAYKAIHKKNDLAEY
jgi:hypothetical protein